MQPPLAILCYHRVLADEDRRGAGRPYFARGTAVGEGNFAAHVRSVVEHLDVLTEAEVLSWLDGQRALRRPSCWITFDDGYRDVLDRAAPVLAHHRVPATMFVTTGVLEHEGRWLPADRWYATLHRATRRHGALSGAGDGPWEFDLAVTRDYERLVDGPERRRFLRAAPDDQPALLELVARALGAPALPAADLYLDRDGLQHLVELGWSIGGHGHDHAILTHVAGSQRASEIRTPRHFLETLGLSPRTFAYPDGASDDGVVDATRDAGWVAAVCLGNRAATREDRFVLPRFVPRDDPKWIEEVLVPWLLGGEDRG